MTGREMDAKVLPFRVRAPRRPAETMKDTAETYELGPHDRMTAEQALEVVRRENPPNVLIVYTVPGQDESGEDVEHTVVRHSGNLSNADINFLADKLKMRSLGFEV